MRERSWAKLWREAERARKRAYARYSEFQVGAAIEVEGGLVVSGCNVENASYGLTLCAERNAVGTMIALGKRAIQRVAIVVDHSVPVPPCGMCRQVLREFAANAVEVRSRTLDGQELSTTVGELLPFAFTPQFLGRR